VSWRLLRGRRLPSLTVALGAAGAVLALAAAAVAPTLAAAGDAAAVAELDRIGPAAAGIAVTGRGTVSADEVTALGDQLAADLGAAAGPGTVSVQVDPVVLAHDATEVRVRPVGFSRVDVAVTLVAGRADGGLVLPAELAEELGVSPGDRVTLRRGDVTTEAAVAGTAQPLDPVLVPLELSDLVTAADTATDAATGSGRRPIDLVVARPETALDLAAELAATTTVTWRHPARDELGGAAEARRARSAMLRAAAALDDPRTDLGAVAAATYRQTPEATVGMGQVVRETDAAVAALAGPARAVGIAGQVVALAVVAAAALFAARSREVELRLAAVRGRSPLRQGARAAVRAVPPLALGALVGTTAALLLVRAITPGGEVSLPTVWSATAAVGIAFVPALVVVGVVTAGLVATTVRVGRRRRLRRLDRWPWEAVVLGLAAIAWLQLRLGGGLSADAGPAGLHPLVLGFPVLVLVGSIGLAVRVGRRALPALRRLGGSATASRFLAVRRLAAASHQGLVLAGASALALGLVVYSAGLAASLRVAVEEKTVLQLGADAVAPGAGVSSDAADGTRVLRASGSLQPDGLEVDVLLVDPATLTRAAYWDRGLGDGASLNELLGALDADGDRLPVLLAGAPDADPVVVAVPGFRQPIEVAARVEAFAGQAPTRPLVVAAVPAAARLAPAEPGSAVDAGDAGVELAVAGRWRQEVWTAGPDAGDRLVAAGADPATVRSSADAAARPRLVVVTWALGALQAFAVLATGLALVGVLLFVASRQRATQVSYALARRMGLAPSSHRAALGTEVLALLTTALVLAGVFGLSATALVAGTLDPLPDLPPAPRLVWPGGALLLLSGTLLAAGLVGAALLQRSADRVNVAEVLRGG
jgi:hypothetical protein